MVPLTSPAWYAPHSALTDPREHASLIAGLPAGVGPLTAVVRGLIIHPVAARRLGLPHEPEPGAAHLRFVADMLAYLDELADTDLAPEHWAWLDRAAELTDHPAELHGLYMGSPRGRSVLERLSRATMRA